MREKRGQAAMEFLMTYGWAILAAVIVVGVLWYIIGNPANLAGNDFKISQPLTPEGMAFDSTANEITIEFRNGLADPISVKNIEIETCTAAGDTFTDQSIASGVLSGAIAVTCDGNGTALVADSRFNGDVTVYYTKGTGAVEQQATGSITGRVP